MLGEEALLDAHHQRGGFENGDIAQLDRGGFQLGGGGWVRLRDVCTGPAAVGWIAEASGEQQGGAEGGTEQGEEATAAGHGLWLERGRRKGRRKKERNAQTSQICRDGPWG
jgi:hypothetical protein